MALSYDDAIATLASMFGDWDRETLGLILQSNNYQLESSIEFILASGALGASSIGSAAAIHPDENISTRQAELNPRSELELIDPSFPGASTRRGVLCELPDDFLRLPNSNSSKRIVTDEEIALMMQNEIYLRAMTEVQRDRVARTASGAPDAASSRRRTASKDAALPDMGILKGLQGVGDTVKKRFDSLTQRITAVTSGSTSDSKRQQAPYQAGSSDNAELNPLVHGADDEDEEESVEFLSSPHAQKRMHQSSSSSANGK